MSRRSRKRRHGARPARSSVALSVCIIARDEASRLATCLGSVRELAAEIVVVDTGSQDDTRSVARAAGARVLTQQWNGDFAVARNRSLEAARGTWILVLDCDEVLAARDHEHIRRAMQASEVMAYRLTTRNYTRASHHAGWVACTGEYAEEKGYPGWFPTTKVRLWRRHREVRFEGAVHELVEASIMRLGGTIGDCMAPVHHYGYVEKERPLQAYLEAGERKARQAPDDLRARFELALAYRDAGRMDAALASIDEVMQGLAGAAAERRVYVQEELVLLARAEILNRLGRIEAALAAYEETLQRFPQSFQALNNMGLLQERRGDVSGARKSYAAGAALAPDNRQLAENLMRLDAGSGTTLGGAQQAPEPASVDAGASKGLLLSVCVIARDEAQVLGRCLDSVMSVADEIVVVDTGSQDATVDIARAHGARVGHYSWEDDFAAARNESLRLARGQWVLWMDADDYLPDATVRRLRQLKRSPADRAYLFQLVNQGDDRTRFRQLKMFPRRGDLRFERPVHETVLPAVQRAGLPMVEVEAEVHHTGYADAERTRRKTTYYLRLMEKWLHRHPQDLQIAFRIGHSYYVQGQRERALLAFEAILARCAADTDDVTRRRAATFAGRCLLEMGRAEDAIAPLHQAHEMCPEDALALLSLGDAYLKVGNLEQARTHLQAALRGRLDADFPLDGRLLRYSTHFFLGQVHQATGHQEAARAAFVAAQTELPQRCEASTALSQLDGAAVRESTAHMIPRSVTQATGGSGGGKLSLCMIVRDEEEHLGACLESVAGLADEIIVVDTGSTDATEEIARKHGARLGHFTWCDDWAAARNESLRLATGDWILWLDADDLLPADGHGKIRQLLTGNERTGYFFVLDDQGYENVSCLQMRLFPNIPGVAFEMPVHEQVTPSLARLGIDMVATDIRVLHTGYATPEVVRAKKDRYLRIMEAWLQEHPEDYIVRSHVALTYHTTGRLQEAEQAYRTILFSSRCKEDRNYVVYTTALLFLGRTYLKMQRLEEALDFMRQAEEVDPDYILIKLSLAEVLKHRGDYQAALQYARAIPAGGRQLTFFPVDHPEVLYSAHVLAGQILQALKRIPEAVAAFRLASRVPVARSSEALGSLAELYQEQGQMALALQVLEEAQRSAPENIQHVFNLGAMHLAEGHLDAAESYFRQVLEHQPGQVPALLNLGYIAKSRGELEEAETIYRQAMERDRDGVEGPANLAHLLLDQERYEEAGGLFRRVLSRRDGLLDIELGLLCVTAHQGDWLRSRQLAEKLGTRFPHCAAAVSEPVELARTLIPLGAELVRRELPKCAELALLAATFLDPDLGEANRALGELYIAHGKYWPAVAQFEQLLRCHGEDRRAFHRLGDCYAHLGVEDAARMCYARARQLHE